MRTKLERGAGILLHITSLPSKFGIGDFGEEAYKFVSFLKESNQKYWQILPFGADGEYNSPYRCSSTFAGNDLLISLEKLVKSSLLSSKDLLECEFDQGNIDYDKVKHYKENLLSKAYRNFKKLKEDDSLHKEMNEFVEENNFWLEDYVLFKTASEKYGSKDWSKWENGVKNRDQICLQELKIQMSDQIDKYTFIQFIFHKQWSELKNFANENGIKIIGDLPIYVGYKSADVWSHRELFDLDYEGNLITVAGFPPDYFSKDGQVWGNPLYKWEEHKKDDFKWWVSRIEHTLKIVDYLRIDHFRGIESFYAIPNDTRKASDGVFKEGPGYELLDAIKNHMKDMPIIVEDLGDINQAVEELRDAYELPGMRILQFGFSSSDALGYNPNFIPYNYIPNSIAYTGTHDNMTVKQWYCSNETDIRVKNNFKRYVRKEDLPDDEVNVCQEMIRLLYSTVASVTIVPLQDILELGEEGRMNYPGIEGTSWRWRFYSNDLTDHISSRLKQLTEIYGR